ncbi:MAG TPA: RNA polymerase sigma-70 factor, partial [Bacteroidetes bacterium]|nr:RNA polymerase sigma-70 factor [Bacteroidota bacterium]
MALSKRYTTLNKDLFEQIFKEYFVHLTNFALKYVYDSEIARDITQKVFINLWEKRNSIDPDKSIKSYLFASVKNRCLNYIRDNKKFRSELLDFEIEDANYSYEIKDIERQELEEKINSILSTLPEKCRQAFVMSRYENMKYKEIAKEMNISEKTVE